MGIYNEINTCKTCPVCKQLAETNVQFRLGWLNMISYNIGDEIVWQSSGIHEPKSRPVNGNMLGEGFAKCGTCGSEYWVLIKVESNKIVDIYDDTCRGDFIVEHYQR